LACPLSALSRERPDKAESAFGDGLGWRRAWQPKESPRFSEGGAILSDHQASSASASAKRRRSDIGPEVVEAPAEVLEEGVPTDDHPRGSVALQPSQRSEARLETVVGLGADCSHARLCGEGGREPLVKDARGDPVPVACLGPNVTEGWMDEGMARVRCGQPTDVNAIVDEAIDASLDGSELFVANIKRLRAELLSVKGHLERQLERDLFLRRVRADGPLRRRAWRAGRALGSRGARAACDAEAHVTR
jgi:hypothetical protein